MLGPAVVTGCAPGTPDSLLGLDIDLHGVARPKHRVILTTCYAGRLRLGEALRLQVTDVDSDRMVLHVAQGKGGRGRYQAVVVRREGWRHSSAGANPADPPATRGRLPAVGKRATGAPTVSAGVLATARVEGEWTQHGKPCRWRGTRQPTAREGQVGPSRVAERPVVCARQRTGQEG